MNVPRLESPSRTRIWPSGDPKTTPMRTSVADNRYAPPTAFHLSGMEIVKAFSRGSVQVTNVVAPMGLAVGAPGAAAGTTRKLFRIDANVSVSARYAPDGASTQ